MTKEIRTVPDLIRRIATEGDNPALFHEKGPEGWRSLSQKEFSEKLRYFALYLHSLDLKEQEAVGILATPGILWTMVDLAAMGQGLVTVPMFSNLSHENFVFEVSQTQIRTLFVFGKEEWALALRHEELFERIVALDNVKESPKAVTFDNALQIGERIDQENPRLFETIIGKVRRQTELATIVYTSGTTGLPKGAMLTHENLVANNHLNPMGWYKEIDRYMSVLPLAHIFGRSLNFLMLHAQIPVYYFNDHKNLAQACQEVKPTVTAVVPRLIERIYAKMALGVEEAPFLKRAIGRWAFKTAQKKGGFFNSLSMKIADLLVFKKLRKRLGGAFRIIISGGAPLNPTLNHFFNRIGIPIYEGYGLTEASIVTVNRPENKKVGSVGQLIEILQVAISNDGEILIKGPIVFQGYYLNPRATKEALDEEGWLHTGDKGSIDEKGFLTIRGRIKELVKSSVGEYIAPALLEQLLMKAPIVESSLIIAEGRKFVSVLLFPNFEVVKKWKNDQKKNHLSDQEFLESDAIQGWMNNFLIEINRHLNHWEEIHRFRFVMTPPTIQGGELTPSLKLRREVVQTKYKELIDSMYPQDIPKEAQL